MPSPFEAVLLGLAAWRVWHLLADDTILDRPRNWIAKVDEHNRVGREGLADFLECPFCLGFWVALAWVGFYAVWPTGAVWAALPFALNAVVVVVNHWLTSE